MAQLGRIKKKEYEEPLVNLTPLIDVVFVILIGFIVVAPLLELDRIELASAGAGSSQTETVQESLIAIHVQADNSIWYKKQRILAPQLEERLKIDKVNYPKAIPQLFHDKKGQFGTYQEVKNALEGAGFDQVDVILKPS